MAAEFRKIPHRDAYAVIRGFRYQVQVTVLAWIQLPDCELLELEAGEDIDWVRLATESQTEVERVLGQSKFRTRSLRLRSPEALMSLFHFYKHKRNNPGIQLRFRYITNASSGFDRGTPHESGLPAVELWEALRSGTIEEKDRYNTVEFIRRLLLSSGKPTEANTEEWKGFKHFLEESDPNVLLEFIGRFEWGLGNATVMDQAAQIRVILQSRTEINSEAGAEAAFACLSTIVMEKLSTRDIKQLSARDCRDALIACKTMILDVTYQGFSSLAERFERTANRLEVASAAFQQVEKVGSLGLAHFGSGAAEIRFGIPELLVESPALVEPHASRAELVNALEQSLRAGTWVALIGDSGVGKSQLVRLVRERFPECLWLNLRETPGPKQAAAVDRVLGLISEVRAPYVSRNWYVSAVSALPPGTLIVLDDLDPGDGGSIASRLALLAGACREHNRFLVSTSGITPPSSLGEALGNAIEFKNVPEYTDQDLLELLRKHAAPKTLLVDHFINTIHIVTHRHPQMVSALIRFMQRQNWKYNLDTVMPLLDGSFADDLRLQTQRTLQQTASEEVRELLYRLNVIGPRFTETQAVEVARISPAIRGVTEKLAEVAGVWVQMLGRKQYAISPLVTQLGSNNLADHVKRATHVYAAEAIIRRKRLNQIDALLAITHLVQARLFNRAAILLIQALNALLYSEEKTVDDGGLLLLWKGMPLPEEMRFELKLFLRGVQTAAAARYGHDYKKPLEDLEILLGVSTREHALGIFIASATTAIHLAYADPKRASKFVLGAIEAEPHLPPEARRIVNSVPLVGLFWVLATGMKTADEISHWFSTVEQLPDEQRKQLWSAPNGPEGALVMLDGLWASEQKKPAAEQQWVLLLDRVREFASRAAAMGGQLLWTFCRRAELVVQIVHLQHFAEAEVLLNETLAAVHEDPVLVFITAQGAGVWWADAGRWKLASQYLARAIDTRCHRFSPMYLRALLWRAWAESMLGRSDPDALNSAVTFARDDAAISELDVIVALCEQAISLWNQNERNLAFVVWEEAVERLLSHSEHSAQWLQIYALIANNSTFFGVVAKGGAATPNVFTPEQGMFLRRWPDDLSSKYSESTMWMLPGAMTWFAEALGKIIKAGMWALKTVEIAESVSLDPTVKFFLVYAVPTAIREGRYIDAIQYALEATASTTQPSPAQVSRPLDAIAEGPGEIEKTRPTREPKRAELEAAQLGLLPAYFDIIRLWQIDEAAGRNAADSVVEKCENIAETAADPELWNRAAGIIRQIFHRELSRDEIWAEANKHIDEYTSFHTILLYFGTGIGFSPEYAFRAQMACVQWVQECFKTFTAMSNQVITYAVNAFWQSLVEKEGHRFRQPTHTLTLLKEAAQAYSLKETLRVVAQSLGVLLSDRDRRWLYPSSPDS